MHEARKAEAAAECARIQKYNEVAAHMHILNPRGLIACEARASVTCVTTRVSVYH